MLKPYKFERRKIMKDPIASAMEAVMRRDRLIMHKSSRKAKPRIVKVVEKSNGKKRKYLV